MNKQQINQTVWTNPIHFIAFGFGSGISPIMPGTCGTLVAIPLYLLMRNLPLAIYIAIVIAGFLIGVWICDVTEKAIGVHDYSGIVWDEVIGYWITMFMAPTGWWWTIIGFILFRIFDIWKPWPVGWIDRHVHGGLGVMVDDVAAAIYAAISLQVLVKITHFV